VLNAREKGESRLIKQKAVKHCGSEVRRLGRIAGNFTVFWLRNFPLNTYITVKIQA
jgi:hypothetical protein